MKTLPVYLVAMIASGLVLGGCSQEPAGMAGDVGTGAAAVVSEEAANEVTISDAPFSQAPSGVYAMDPTHASLSFSISHPGFSNYVARFTQYATTINYDASDITASSLQVDLDPKSIDTDYSADYKAAHPESSFDSWEQDLANSDKFFNSEQYPSVTYRSTAIERTGQNTIQIQGDLTLPGQTHPMTLDATIVGSAPSHPMVKDRGVFGFSATGTFKRSVFGMDFLLSPPMLGDEISLQFEGEFLQAPAAPAPAS